MKKEVTEEQNIDWTVFSPKSGEPQVTLFDETFGTMYLTKSDLEKMIIALGGSEVLGVMGE